MGRRIGTTLEYGILEHQHLAQNRIALEYIGIGIGQQARCTVICLLCLGIFQAGRQKR